MSSTKIKELKVSSTFTDNLMFKISSMNVRFVSLNLLKNKKTERDIGDDSPFVQGLVAHSYVDSMSEGNSRPIVCNSSNKDNDMYSDAISLSCTSSAVLNGGGNVLKNNSRISRVENCSLGTSESFSSSTSSGTTWDISNTSLYSNKTTTNLQENGFSYVEGTSTGTISTNTTKFGQIAGAVGFSSNNEVKEEIYEINQTVYVKNIEILIKELHRLNGSNYITFEVSTNEDLGKFFERYLPYIVIKIDDKPNKISTTFNKITKGCNKCTVNIERYEGKSQQFYCNENQLESIKIELPNIESLDTTEQEFSIETDMEQIKMDNNLNEKEYKIDKKIIAKDERNNEIEFSIDNLKINRGMLFFKLFIPIQKEINTELLIPEVKLLINNSEYKFLNMKIDKKTEGCDICGIEIIGYEVEVCFPRRENFNNFKLDIPYIRIEELTQKIKLIKK